MRIDIFRAIQAAAKNIENSGQKLSAEESLLVSKKLERCRRDGLALPDEKREQHLMLGYEASYYG
jgi:Zn-dependent oligopeptidase